MYSILQSRMRWDSLSQLLFFRRLSAFWQWNWIVLLALMVIAFNAVVFPYFALTTYAQGEAILDTRLFYTAKDVQNFLNALGAAGRSAYSRQLLADMIYPFAYGLLLRFVVLKFCRTKLTSYLALAPLIALLADIAENWLILFMICSFPLESYTIATLGSLFTALKWGMISLTIVGFLMCLIKK